MKIVNFFVLFKPSSHDASLVLLAHSIGKLELKHPLARDGLSSGGRVEILTTHQ
jgi:hypothetical protein